MSPTTMRDVTVAEVTPPNDDDDTRQQRNQKKRLLYSFADARKMARSHGFSDRQEFLDYECPGAYQVPKNPQEVWADDWKGWDDWLGVPWKDFSVARRHARGLRRKSKNEYYDYFQNKEMISDDHAASRLPFRPDLYYKNDWNGWADFLGCHCDEEKEY